MGTPVADGGSNLNPETPPAASGEFTDPVAPLTSLDDSGMVEARREPKVSAPSSSAGGTSKRCQRCRGHSSPSAAFCQFCGTSFQKGDSVDHSYSEPPPQRATGGAPARAELVVIAQDGSPGRRYALDKPEVVIGSSEGCGVALRRDPYVCPEHARVVFRNGGYIVEDVAPCNGVYVRIGGAIPLQNGDLLLLGLAVLHFEVMEEAQRHLNPATRGGTRLFGTPPCPRYARLSLKTVEGVPRDVYYVSRAETVLGREVGDIVFTDDPFMSRRHAAIRRDPNSNQFSVRDLGSSNGTFIAIRNRHAISHGDHIRVGQHLFRLDVRRGE